MTMPYSCIHVCNFTLVSLSSLVGFFFVSGDDVLCSLVVDFDSFGFVPEQKKRLSVRQKCQKRVHTASTERAWGLFQTVDLITTDSNTTIL